MVCEYSWLEFRVWNMLVNKWKLSERRSCEQLQFLVDSRLQSLALGTTILEPEKDQRSTLDLNIKD